MCVCHADVLFRAEHSAVTYSEHSEKLGVSALTSARCKEKLPCGRPWAAIVMSLTIVVCSSFRPMNFPPLEFDQVYSTRRDFPPMECVWNPIRKQFFFFQKSLAILECWPYLTSQVIIVARGSTANWPVNDFSPPAACTVASVICAS